MNKTLIVISVVFSILAFTFSLSLFSSEALACSELCCYDDECLDYTYCSATTSCYSGACLNDPNCAAPDKCAGVTCPPNSGDPSSCNYYDDCDTSGSYPITYWTCNSATGICESGSTYGTCSRNTDFAGCSPYNSYGPWSPCSQLYPSCSGSQARTVTNYYCLSGSCSSSTTTDTQSCTVADGTSCGTNQICSGGTCISTCTNDCTPSGTTQCSGSTAYQTCGNYDADDSCLEWSSVTSCGTSSCPSDSCSGLIYYDFPSSCTQTCSGGTCQSCLCSASETTCNKGDLCKSYSCSAATGCGETNAADGTICGTGKVCSGGSCVASTTACTINADCVSYAASCGNGALDATGPACIGGKCTEPCDSGAPTVWGVGWQCLNRREQYCKSDCSGWSTESLGPCNQQCGADIIVCNKAFPGTYCGPEGMEWTAVCDYNCNCVEVGTLILLSCTGNQLIQSGDYLTLSWTPVGDAYSYWVYYRSYLSPTYTSGWVFAPITTYVVSGLEAGAYLWYVEAYDSEGSWLQTSQIGECGITDLTQTITASKTYAAIGENIELTVTGTVSSPREMTALAVFFQGSWQYCCCKSGCGYGSICSSYGASVCYETWGVTASSSDLAGGKFTYYSGSYDYGPVGDTETAQGGGTYGASVVVNQKECNTGADCVALGKTCGAQGYPNRYAGCAVDYTCTKCDPCSLNEQCESGYCCDASQDVTGGIPISDRGTGECVAEGNIYKSKYLCDPPEWGSQENLVSKKINLFDWLFSSIKRIFD